MQVKSQQNWKKPPPQAHRRSHLEPSSVVWLVWLVWSVLSLHSDPIHNPIHHHLFPTHTTHTSHHIPLFPPSSFFQPQHLLLLERGNKRTLRFLLLFFFFSFSVSLLDTTPSPFPLSRFSSTSPPPLPPRRLPRPLPGPSSTERHPHVLPTPLSVRLSFIPCCWSPLHRYPDTPAL